MIEKVIDNVYVNNAKFIFIVQKEHCTLFDIDKLLIEKCGKLKCNYEIITIDGQTRGAADTVLKARDYIDNKSRLIVCNSDQIMEDYTTFKLLQYTDTKLADGCVVVFERENDIRWSYVKIRDSGTIEEIVEKQQISNLATTGLYFYRHGSDCIKYIEQMIANNDKSNGEYYFAPSMNYAIKDKKRIIPFQIEKMIPLGTPEDYESYIKRK
jgi:dTDP-glucose pyrophosphorylase